MTGDFMSIIKKPPQPSLYNKWGKRASQKSQGRLIVYLIPQQSSINVRLDHVPMSPTPKRAFDLDVLKHVWRIINGVFRNPTRGYRAEDPGLDYRMRANL
jgi:hypothetical protein